MVCKYVTSSLLFSQLILSMWPEELEQIQAKIAKRLEEMVGKKELVNGHFEFEQRARKAAALER